MKTITEMQTQIKEMSSKLDEFAIELSDYNQSENKGSTIDFKQIKAIGIRNPIIGHILEKADTSVKKKYITMLIAIAYMAKEKQENAWLLIQRIATGANFTDELIDLSVDAINIRDGQIDEFTLNIANAKLTNSFVLDAMLIYLSCEKANNKMLEFLSALFELVKCGKKEVQELSELAKIISEQDSKKYLDFCFKDAQIDFTAHLSYIEMFHSGIFCCNNKLCYLKFKHTSVLSKDLFSKLPTTIISKNVIIENVLIDGESIANKLPLFKGNDSIEIKNCIFKKTLQTSIEECEKLIIIGCEFINNTNKALVIQESTSVIIDQCKFKECSKSDKQDAGGTAFYIFSVSSLCVKNTYFVNCCAEASEHYSSNASVVRLNKVDVVELNKCEFDSCTARKYIDVDVGIINCEDSQLNVIDCKYKNIYHKISNLLNEKFIEM